MAIRYDFIRVHDIFMHSQRQSSWEVAANWYAAPTIRLGVNLGHNRFTKNTLKQSAQVFSLRSLIQF